MLRLVIFFMAALESGAPSPKHALHRPKIGLCRNRLNKLREDLNRALKVLIATHLNLRMHVAIWNADTRGSNSTTSYLNRVGVITKWSRRGRWLKGALTALYSTGAGTSIPTGRRGRLLNVEIM